MNDRHGRGRAHHPWPAVEALRINTVSEWLLDSGWSCAFGWRKASFAERGAAGWREGENRYASVTLPTAGAHGFAVARLEEAPSTFHAWERSRVNSERFDDFSEPGSMRPMPIHTVGRRRSPSTIWRAEGLEGVLQLGHRPAGGQHEDG